KQGFLRPVQVLDECDDRALGRETLQQVDPGAVEPVARGERVEIGGDVEPERKSEDLATAEPLANGFRRIAVQDAQVLLEALAERPVRDPLSVGETTAGAAERLRRLRGESLPQLAPAPCLPDSRVGDD